VLVIRAARSPLRGRLRLRSGVVSAAPRLNHADTSPETWPFPGPPWPNGHSRETTGSAGNHPAAAKREGYTIRGGNSMAGAVEMARNP